MSQIQNLYARPVDVYNITSGLTPVPSVRQCKVVSSRIDSWCSRQTLYLHYGVHYFRARAIVWGDLLPVHELTDISYITTDPDDPPYKWETVSDFPGSYTAPWTNDKLLQILDRTAFTGVRLTGRFGWGFETKVAIKTTPPAEVTNPYAGTMLRFDTADADDKRRLFYVDSWPAGVGDPSELEKKVSGKWDTLVDSFTGARSLDPAVSSVFTIDPPEDLRSVAMMMLIRFMAAERSAGQETGILSAWRPRPDDYDVLLKYRQY